MRELLNALKPWVVFVLVVAVLFWAPAVLVPFALSILLTFLLAPLVGLLQRGVPLKARYLAKKGTQARSPSCSSRGGPVLAPQ
jgi:predicted PurR-regulated permease PerM